MKRLAFVAILTLFTLGAFPAFAADAGKADSAVTVDAKVAAAAEVPKGGTNGEVPPPAPQAEVQQVVWWEVLVKNAMELGFLILTLMVTAVVRVVGKKYGFSAYTDQVNSVLSKAASYAEQKSIAAAKLEDGKPSSGAEKMTLAVSFAKKMGKDYKIKSKGSDWWEHQLESWLGMNGK